jgi:hypothetical protein
MNSRWWVHEFVGAGDHSFRLAPDRSKAFESPLAALREIITRFGDKFVNDNFDQITAGPCWAEITWINDDHGVLMSTGGPEDWGLEE